jgi:DNA-binding NarL/FixJ family response regulator
VVSVFLVDDHEVVRRGLIDSLKTDPELDIVGEAGSVAEAMARIPALRPDVAVLDVRQSGRGGADDELRGAAAVFAAGLQRSRNNPVTGGLGWVR